MPNGRPRRLSIFSGLLLILLGVLFLWHNFRGGFAIWRLFATWWPLLLIFWGLAKLYDHMVARRTGQAAPSTVSGGDIFLVILVVALVGGIGIADMIPRGRIRGERMHLPWVNSYDFSESLPVKSASPGAPISISTNYGDISVHGEDSPEIRVEAKKNVMSSSEGEARRLADQARVEILGSDQGYEVRTREQGGEIRVDLEIRVPTKTNLTLRTQRGDVEVKGITGSVTAERLYGDARIRDTGGDVSLEISHGDAHVVNASGNVKVSGSGGEVEIADVKGEAVLNGEFYGPIRFERVVKGMRFVSKRSDLTVSQLSGRIEIGTGRTEISDAPGNVNLVTSKKDVALENVSGKVHIEDRDGNIELRFPQPPREPIEVTNASGNIGVVLPPKSAFQVSAESRNGEIACEWDEIAGQKVEDHNAAKLDAKVGAKGPLIRLRTSYGTISLRKGQ